MVSRHFYTVTFTKEEGTFRIADMPAGEYLLVANKRGERTGRTQFAPVYYPGTLDRKAAEIVKIGRR